MSIKPVYVPILKWKLGEQGALAELSVEIKDNIIPLIEIVPDCTKKKLKTSLKSWENRLFYFDVLPECYEDDEDIYFNLLKELDPNYVIPVLCIDDDLKFIQDVYNYSNNGIAFRITGNDGEDIEDYLEDILNIFDPSNVDLIFDMKAINEDNYKEKFTILKSILSDIPKIELFRNTILASASFPENLNNIQKYSFTYSDRLDWNLWNKCLKLNKKYNIVLIYSDYCINSPDLITFVPGMQSSFKLKYTAEESFVIVKGDTLKKGGLEADKVSNICNSLINSNDFADKDFSWGDEYIYTRATEDVDRYGNLTTWIKVGTNHHITLVINQLSNLL